LLQSKPLTRILLLPLLALLLAAVPAPAQSTNAAEVRGAELKRLAAEIGAELKDHGERTMGREMVHWSTRLQYFDDCHASVSVRTDSKYASPTIRIENVTFLLGALDPLNIDLQKKWMSLSCKGAEKCITSSSTCSTRSKEGIVTDCSTSGANLTETYALHYDGDAASAERLKRAFQRAIEVCRQPIPVHF